MLNKICLLIMMQLWLIVGAAFAAGITIVVAPQAKVEGPVITLGQIAEISGDDSEWIKSLGQIKLGSTPTLGSSVVLTNELFHTRLAATGSDFSGIVWKIPETITLTTVSQSISRQTLIDKAILAIRHETNQKLDDNDISITPIGIVQDVIAPLGKIDLTAYLLYGVRYNMPTNIMISVNVDGQAFTKVPLKFDVKRYGQVVVSATEISRAEVLSPQNLRYERMDLGRLGAGYFTDTTKIFGLTARRALNPGMIITNSAVVKPVVIKQGATVNILARVGSMEVTSAGQALQDGIEGQLIRVQNINSTKIISAKVIDGTTVQVLTYRSNG